MQTIVENLNNGRKVKTTTFQVTNEDNTIVVEAKRNKYGKSCTERQMAAITQMPNIDTLKDNKSYLMKINVADASELIGAAIKYPNFNFKLELV